MNRIIMHIDMNSYFASVEQQANPFLRGRAIGVTGKRFDLRRQGEAQRSIIATASREAKALGVKTAMSTVEALRICPTLIIIPGDPEKYSEIPHRFVRLFHEFTDDVQQTSVDECYLDVTKEAGDYFGATIMAQAIRSRLKEVCGEWITASIGIGPNKLIAKLGSEYRKPNGLTVVQPNQVLPFLDTLRLRDFCGIGYKTERHLAELGITTVQGLRDYPIDRLATEFKSWGLWLHEAAWGRDVIEVEREQVDQKSFGHSHTFPHDIDSVQEIKRNVLAMCDKIAWRLRREGFSAGLVNVYFRYGKLDESAPQQTGHGQQRRFQESTNDGLTLFKIAWSLVETWWDGTPVRLIGVSASMLTRGQGQNSLFKNNQKVATVVSALDKIQTRYGSTSWTRASLVGIEFRARSSGWHYDHES